MRRTKVTYPAEIRAYAIELMGGENPPNSEIMVILKRKFGVDISTSAIHYWRKASGRYSPKKNKVPKTRGEHLETPLCRQFNNLVSHMTPRHLDRKLGVPQ